MSGELLSPPAPGFFGKIPSTGDFVSRGLPDVFRQRWDAWVTRHLAPILRDVRQWPEDGLRFRLASGGRVVAGVVLAGADSAGRAFPLSLLLIGDNLGTPDKLDKWCDAALASARSVLEDGGDAERLWAALGAIDPPGQGGREEEAMLVWTKEVAPEACAPDDPGPLLDRLIGHRP
ncbi:hypothetical protein DEA8626_02232 [Defluviimonas aquaemixtae]|uniref:Type VI secretion system-associated protein TagF n=1 Tax=Albidovulum aquaemixtae TaxID=1542388 RepID=A0A2R8B7U8_9RHOB|nr:type VI secretion system-associated protein TagF [Defluviimonas aquaemixtae]SPH18690.1 hypothetical protein DEA8626_02232 [Defluviimonas aquaemixtae]